MPKKTTPYTVEKIVVFTATSMDGKKQASGKTEEEAVKRLGEMEDKG